MNDPFITLGIETSCDETAVAVLKGETEIVSNLIYSQAEIHARYGGVVPEVASRDHLRKLPYLVKDTLAEAGIGTDEISLVAATRGPGLIGPLLVGSTVDDAAGEALDKVGKMIGIGYPAGAMIDRLAEDGDPKAIPFPRPMASSPGFDFSFAGLKTAVLYHLKKNPRERVEDVAASTLASVVEILTQKAIEATRRYHRSRLVVVGGVAANAHLREELTAAGRKRGIDVHFPPIRLCTDNAAMIAAAGAFRHLSLGESDPLSVVPDPRLGL